MALRVGGGGRDGLGPEVRATSMCMSALDVCTFGM